MPILTDHVTDDLWLYLYYGSRAAQPRRVRAFIDPRCSGLQATLCSS